MHLAHPTSLEQPTGNATNMTDNTWDADKLDKLYNRLKYQETKMHDHTLALQVLENKVAVLLGDDPQRPQSSNVSGAGVTVWRT